MKRVVSAVLMVSVLLLSGCGDDGTDTASDPGASDTPSLETSAPAEPSPSESELTPSESASASADPLPDWPTCAEVWVVDATLPSDYAGCLQDQTAVQAKNQFCEFGRKLVTYADQFWAVREGKVNDAGGPLKDSQDYRDDLASCKG